MQKARWLEIDKFVKVLMELEEKDRRILLDKAREEDPRLFEEASALLKAQDKVDNFLETPVARPFSEAMRWNLETVSEEPECIDKFRILEKIGEGGMGSVYLAEQNEPFSRRVALKIIKTGLDSKEARARFTVEHLALARMEHAHIARIFEAGITEDGRPFFTMEHCPGHTIMEHCEKYNLSLKERLKMFLKICDAIQHAHQKGVIHRDIKPSNILVVRQSLAAVPKVIDFGIAKP